MAENKTKASKLSVDAFLNTIADEGIRKDCLAIADTMSAVTGESPVMWGSSIIGFGSYHYKYDSGREGDMCLVGFSPRKQNITLYLMGEFNRRDDLLENLGKFKTGKGCLYIKKLADVNVSVLNELIKGSVAYMKSKYPA
ncbi:MAG: DUF1801 domain-containing protein [Bacteroidetes bacterium]|nr:DUF1801 domain-containing protein [Bacteroidota bacterium]